MYCIHCHDRLIAIKKRKLCMSCYSKLRRIGFENIADPDTTQALFLNDHVVITREEYEKLKAYETDAVINDHKRRFRRPPKK